jgi:hypothetical protein
MYQSLFRRQDMCYMARNSRVSNYAHTMQNTGHMGNVRIDSHRIEVRAHPFIAVFSSAIMTKK